MNEDVFPVEHGDFPASHASFQGCNMSEPLKKGRNGLVELWQAQEGTT